MTSPYHMIVWLDHKEAKVFGIDGDVHFARLENPLQHERIHRRAGTMGPGHLRESAQHLKAVADALSDAREIVIAGPAQAKQALMDWIKEHAPQTAAKVVGVEALDHPSHGEIVAFAKRYFRAKDRMTPQLPS